MPFASYRTGQDESLLPAENSITFGASRQGNPCFGHVFGVSRCFDIHIMLHPKMVLRIQHI